MQNTTNSLNFEFFVISLKRTPQRLADFFTRNKPSNLPFQVFDAVDGSQLDPAMTAAVVAPGAARYTPGIVGCAMSHRALWEKCIASDKPYVILEDDAAVRADAHTQLTKLITDVPDWEIILLGYNTDAPMDLNIAPGIDFYVRSSVTYPSAQHLTHFVKSTNPAGLQRLITAFGTCGYAVTPKGARELLNTCFPMDNRIVHLPSEQRAIPSYGIDCLMIGVYRKVRAYACLPPLVLTSIDQSDSTIGQR